MSKVDQRDWREVADENRRQREREKRERWVKDVCSKLAVMTVLSQMEDAPPAREVSAAIRQSDERNYQHEERIAVVLRKLAEMGMVIREKRKYESVVRWVLTEEGAKFIDMFQPVDEETWASVQHSSASEEG